MSSLKFLYETRTLLLVFMLTLSQSVRGETKFKGIAQLSFASSDSERPYIEGGQGRYLYQNDEVRLSQAFITIDTSITPTLTAHGVLNHTRVVEADTGFTQLFLKYKPILSADYRWQFRAGLFYPATSFENVDIGWLSPYTYTNSGSTAGLGKKCEL